jgi:hypothetical protein
VPTNTAAAVGAHGAKELAEIVAALTRSQRDAEAVIRSKDVARLKTAVAVIAHAERRGGELLVKLGGQFKPLPVSPADRKRWRKAAVRSPMAFEAKLKRDVAKALARIDPAAGKATSSRPPALARSPAKRSPSTSPREPHVKLSDWHREADGSLTRTLTSVDDARQAPC